MKACLALLALMLFTISLGNTVSTRFKPPAGFTRVNSPAGSFGAWLQNLPLKPRGSHTLTYKGAIAQTDGFTAAVVDFSIGDQDLQQCADAVMRLRAEYLYQKKDFQHIAFNFTSGFKCDYMHYASGYRYADGKWVLKGKKDYGYDNFLHYLKLVFSYAGTLSLEKELKPVSNATDLRIGDVFIKGGSPGHCFIIIDMAVNTRGDKQFMLAQSFMPAQSIQVLQQSGNPWFSLGRPVNIWYGELINSAYLKRF